MKNDLNKINIFLIYDKKCKIINYVQRGKIPTKKSTKGEENY